MAKLTAPDVEYTLVLSKEEIKVLKAYLGNTSQAHDIEILRKDVGFSMLSEDELSKAAQTLSEIYNAIYGWSQR